MQNRPLNIAAANVASADKADLAARSTNGRFFRLLMQRKAGWAESCRSLQPARMSALGRSWRPPMLFQTSHLVFCRRSYVYNA